MAASRVENCSRRSETVASRDGGLGVYMINTEDRQNLGDWSSRFRRPHQPQLARLAGLNRYSVSRWPLVNTAELLYWFVPCMTDDAIEISCYRASIVHGIGYSETACCLLRKWMLNTALVDTSYYGQAVHISTSRQHPGRILNHPDLLS